MKMTIIFAILLTSATCFSKTHKTNRVPSSEAHKACVNAALDSIYTSQVNELNLTAQQRALFTVEWYGSMINNDPEFKKIEAQLKLICTKAFIMAVPIQENR